MSDLHPESENYRALLLRFWRENESAEWRINLRHVRTGSQQQFGEFAALFAYIEEAFGENAACRPQPDDTAPSVRAKPVNTNTE